jgi:hypothetical protein
MRSFAQYKEIPMHRRSWTTLVFVFAIPCFSLSFLSCAGDSDGGGGGTCGTLSGYTATTTTPLSFATDIHPILSATQFAIGCSQTIICHGTPSAMIDMAGTKTFSLIDPPATVKTTLLQQAPVNAPGMKFVVPGNVGASFLAYKISSATELACINSMCTAGASVGLSQPCGDPMPVGGVLTAAERTKILDWIAQGAAN